MRTLTGNNLVLANWPFVMSVWNTKFLSLVLLLLAIVLFWWASRPDIGGACIESTDGVAVCAASAMARVTKTARIPLEHTDFDLSLGAIKLVAARNETVAYQLILRTTRADVKPLRVELSEWRAIGNDSADAPPAHVHTKLFQSHYHWVKNGGYTWGPESNVLAWPDAYPDALIPQYSFCQESKQTLFEHITLPAKKKHNQAIWLEMYIPTTLQPGVYGQTVLLKSAQDTLTIPIELTVKAAVLPDKPSINALGEVYRAYNLEGVGYDMATPQWQHMSQCYQQLAHAHRLIFIERADAFPEIINESDYAKAFGPALSGTLFGAMYGYQGTGANQPVAVWRTPWPQQYDVELSSPLTESQIQRYQNMAKTWSVYIDKQGWDQVDYFAYLFDEVDGPASPATNKAQHHQYIAMTHEQMDRVQGALDAGSKAKPIDLLWTSHSNPAAWTNDPVLDLTSKIRLWAPNASAADPTFLGARVRSGDKAWFYHSGHPAVGVHSINASGIEMRTWGVIAARYGFSGQFMWAINLGSDDQPFAQPSYKPDDDRFGNGVMVYPGNQLNKIGFAKIPGPIPSMRLKAWRRGLQDAELFFLAQEKHPEAARTLINDLIPTALADATGPATWPSDPARWIEFRKTLLELASD